MKKRYILAAALASLLGLGTLTARTWTSADGKKTFKGELKALDKAAGKITVLLSTGKTVSFSTELLSDADKEFIRENEAAIEKVGGEAEAEDALNEQKIGKGLAKEGVLSKLAGEKFAGHKLEKAPEYYIVYFSASW